MEGMNQPHQVRGQQPQYDNAAPAQKQRKSQGWLHPTLESKITVILLVIAAVLVLGAITAVTFSKDNGTLYGHVAQDKHQAVFLSNGQVYFGKITGMNSQAFTLEDIYYLQVDQQLQPGEETDSDEPRASLVKLGDELHGPEDQMFINTNEIIFWENLKTDGQVSEAIEAHSTNGESQGMQQESQTQEEQQQPATQEEVTEEE